MMVIPEPARRLHALAWQPGATMAHGWWGVLGLRQWEAVYQREPGCRRAIDRLIVQRRDWPRRALDATPDGVQQALLALESRLEKLVSALGLIALGDPGYLVLGRYRQELQACGLSPQDVRQLWPFMAGGAAAGRSDAEVGNLPKALLAAGSRCLSAVDEPAWHAMRYCLPPPADGQAPGVPMSSKAALRLLIRLGRFL